MGWGIGMGIGNALTDVSGMMLDNYKTKMRDKLELEREQRAEARELAREERQQLMFNETRNELRDGAWYEVDYNKAGREMEARLANQGVVEAMTRAEQKEKLSLEKLMAETNKLNAEAEFIPEKEAADLAYRRALTGQANRAYTGVGRGGGSSGGGTSGKYKALNESSIDAFFTERNDKGHKLRDAEKLREFYSSEEYARIPDKNEAAAAWANNQNAVSSLEESMRADGKPEFAIREATEAMKAGGEIDTTKIPQLDSLPPEQREKAELGLRAVARARALIAEGKLTKEQARQQLIDRGFPRLAEQLR